MKTKLNPYFFAFLLLLTLPACGSDAPQQSEAGSKPQDETPAAQPAPGQVAPAQGNAKEQGKAYAQQAAKALFGALQASIQQRGVAASIGFCNQRAYAITDSVAQANGVQMKRVSHKARNPQNQASIQEMIIIDKYQEALSQKQAPKPVVQQQGDAQVFYAPIVIPGSLCLACHGQPEKDIAPETLAAIRKTYPEDQATGFAVGELRGLWRITLPAQQLSMR